MSKTSKKHTGVRPKYPVYIISKGRSGIAALTARCLVKDDCDFHIVIEPQDYDDYAVDYKDQIIVLPFSNLGQGSIPARNFVWEHAKAAGYERHWILDDNIRYFRRRYKGRRFNCNANIAFAGVEEFVDRYENIAIAGMNYSMFCPDKRYAPPYYHNTHVYSCLLIRNDLPFRWRGRYNEDTDLCLQVLTSGWCTIATNVFLAEKMQTLKTSGGNSDALYQGHGRLKMSRSLERMWPGLVTTRRRFGRAQHHIAKQWAMFTTPLKRKAAVTDHDNVQGKFEMQAVQSGEGIKSKQLRGLFDLDDSSEPDDT